MTTKNLEPNSAKQQEKQQEAFQKEQERLQKERIKEFKQSRRNETKEYEEANALLRGVVENMELKVRQAELLESYEAAVKKVQNWAAEEEEKRIARYKKQVEQQKAAIKAQQEAEKQKQYESKKEDPGK